jgi:hypothetical protein
MPKNPFAGKRPGMQLSPLLQLLQQQEQQQPNASKLLMDEGMAQQQIAPDAPPQIPGMPWSNPIPQAAPRQQAAPSPIGPQPNPWAGMSAGMGFGGPSNDLLRRPTGRPDMPHDQRAGATVQGASDLFASITGNAPDAQPKAAPPAMQPGVGGGAGGQDSPGEPSLLERLNEERMRSNQGFGMIPPGINDAVQDSVKQYGIAQDDFEQAQFALKQEFQDTPEIDNALNSAHQMLAEARANRKQPSAWDFIAMALMNLSGIHPATSAAMVLGLDDQGRREGMLEDRIFGLEDARSGAKMQGRRDLRGMEMQQGMAQQEAKRRAQEMELRQANLDREFGLKQQDQGIDLMRALAGQESETERTSMDGATRKKAGMSRDLLKQLMQMDDPSLQRMLQQQRQAQPKDNRQSRMFGGLIGDSFA